MPDEYAHYEQELDNLGEQQQHLQESKLHAFPSPELSEIQKVAALAWAPSPDMVSSADCFASLSRVTKTMLELCLMWITGLYWHDFILLL